jgi:hypothetical protein
MEDIMSTVPCLIFILERLSSRDLIAACRALCSLTELGEDIFLCLIDSGYLQQILSIIRLNPQQFQEDSIDDFLRNLILYSSSSTLQTIFTSMNYLEILLSTGHLQSIVDALDCSLTVIDKLIEVNLIPTLIEICDRRDCYNCVVSCTFLANESQMRSLVNQGNLNFFVKCLQQSSQLEKTLKLMRRITQLDPSYLEAIQREAGVELNRLKLEKNVIISRLAEELVQQFPSNV